MFRGYSQDPTDVSCMQSMYSSPSSYPLSPKYVKIFQTWLYFATEGSLKTGNVGGITKQA